MISAKKKSFLCLSIIGATFHILIDFYSSFNATVFNADEKSLSSIIHADFEPAQEACFNIIRGAKVDLSWICDTSSNLFPADRKSFGFKFDEREKASMSKTGKVLFMREKIAAQNRTFNILIWNHGRHLAKRQGKSRFNLTEILR